MAFITDKEDLKSGLILFRRADVAHRNWYRRVKLPKVDRYKTVSLKTDDKTEARTKAWRQFADVEFRLEHGVPVFNRPFSQVAEEYERNDVRDRDRAGRCVEDRDGVAQQLPRRVLPEMLAAAAG